MPTFNEKEAFIADNFKKPSKQNKELGNHLRGVWRKYRIVSIKRIVIGSISGWLAVYRE